MTALQEGFTGRLATLVDRHPEAVGQLDRDAARELGARGAEAALAPLIWAAAVGERWPTTMVTEFLSVTRQALHKRVVNGTALGLPGRGTTLFPVWQFDLGSHEVRPVVAEVIAAFRDELGPVEPLLIASWATTDQPELGMAPEEWLEKDKDPTELARIARRAATELAR